MDKLKKLIEQGIKFSIVGVFNTLIDMGVFYLLTLIAFFAKYYLLANVISYTCGVVNSLFMNKAFTFKEKGKMGAIRVIAFFMINVLSLGVSTLVLKICCDSIGMAYMMGKLIAVIASLGVNFVLNKLIVFRDI